MDINLPVSCNKCGDGKYVLTTRKLKPDNVKCDVCGDLFLRFKYPSVSSNVEKELKAIRKVAIGRIDALRKSLPEDKKKLVETLRDPSDPFTLAVITSIVLIAIEMSSASISVAVAWLLGGGALVAATGGLIIPLVIAVWFYNKEMVENERFSEHTKRILRGVLKEYKDGEIGEEKFNKITENLVDQIINSVEQHEAMPGDNVLAQHSGDREDLLDTIFYPPFQQIYEDIKGRYPEHLVIIENGRFYDAFHEDAEYIGSVRNYEVYDQWGNGIKKIGFPVRHAESVWEDLQNSDQPFIVVGQLLGRDEEGRVQRKINEIFNP